MGNSLLVTIGNAGFTIERDRNLGELFRLHKLLGAHTKLRQGDCSRVLPTDLEAEREAWKAHFEAIQNGAGDVADRVWANIPIGWESKLGGWKCYLCGTIAESGIRGGWFHG